MHSNLFGPTKAVCYGEVSTVKGVCYKRFHCTYILRTSKPQQQNQVWAAKHVYTSVLCKTNYAI